MGFGAAAFDAAVSLNANLAFLAGSAGGASPGLLLLDAAVTGFLVPLGLFLVLCGITLHLRALHPPGRSRAFHAALGGAGLNLMGGLGLGVLGLSLDLFPPEMFTLGLLRAAVIVIFGLSLLAAAGLLVAFCGMAALLRSRSPTAAMRPATRIRAPRGKSIYRGVPSAR